MENLRRKLAIAGFAACIAALTVPGCGGGDDEPGGTDAGEMPTDGGGMEADGGGMGMDAGRDGGPVDPCEGRTLCTTEGTSCDGEVVVTCAEDADGCLVETRNDCAIGGDVCEVASGTATCVDPCSLLPAEMRCDAEGRSCDGNTLEVCAADAMGCLVVTATDCTTETTDGICNPAGGTGGDTAVCEGPSDPCAGVTQCGTAESRACNGDGSALVVCAMDAMGCFVEMTMPCATPDVCNESRGMPACVPPRGSNDSCATAESVTVSRTISDEDLSLGGARPSATDCGGGSGANTLYYAVEIPALTRVQVQTSPDDDIVLMTLDACGATECSYATDSFPESATLTNPGTAAITRVVAIRPYFSDDLPTYDIEFTYESLAPNAACGAATAITGTTTVSGEDVSLGGLPPSSDAAVCSTDGDEETLYYELSIPAMTGVDIALTEGSSDTDVVMLALDSCDATSCAFRNDGDPERGRVVNATGETVTRVVAVHNLSAGDAGSFDLAFTYSPLATGATCAGAQRVDAATTFTGESLSVGGLRPRGTGCQSSGTDTALYYEVVIPALTTAIVTTTPGSGTDIALVAQATCGEAACTHSTNTSPEQIRIANSSAAPVTRYVAVHGGSSTISGTFDIAFAYEALAANASCGSAQEVTATATFTGESTTLGGERPAGTGCASTTTGDGALYYAVTIQPGFAVDVTTAGTLDRVLVTLDACDATSCSYSTNTPPESARLVNTTGAAVTRIVAIHPSSASEGGTFDVTFTYVDLADNASCAGATAITEGSAPLTGENLATGGPRPVGTGCSTTGGDRTLYYAVEIPSMRSVEVVVTPTSGDVVLLTQESCAADTCASRSDVTGPERTRLVNTGASAITRIVAVHGASSTATAPVFNIAFNYATIAPNSVCSGATDVMGDTTLPGENLALGGPRPQGTDCGTGSGDSALYYDVTIPANSAVDVTVTPGAASVNTALVVQDACGATSCTAAVDAAAGSPERTTILNATAAPISRIVAVHNASASSMGTFSVIFDERAITCGDGRIEGSEACDDGNTGATDGCSPTCTVEPNFLCTGTPSTCRAVAPNALCSGASIVTETTTLTGENPVQGGPRPTGTDCGTLDNVGQSRALYYAVTIPAQTRVEVTTAGDGDRVLLTQDACGAAACTLWTDSAPERATLRNDTMAPITRIVAIHPYSTSTDTWDVTFTYEPYVCGDGVAEGAETCDDDNMVDGDGCTACVADAGYACVGSPSVCVSGAPPNAYCAAAEPVTADTTLSGESTAVGGPVPTGTGCGSGGTRALYYAVTIEAGQQVRVQTSNITGDLSLFTLPTCGAAACTSTTNTAPEGTTFVNRGTSPITRIVGVRSTSSTTPATFDIAFTYSVYPITTISAACVSTAGGATVVSGDDSVSTSAMLPFAFSYFGSAVTHWSASTNGNLQLSVGSASGNTTTGEVQIPSTSAPNGVVAAFWDDLVVNSPATVRSVVIGEAGSRRFVVEWQNVNIYSASGTLTFQAHLIEGTNQIELHYCSASATTARLTGSSATIGMESVDGMAGVQVSYNTEGAATPGNGYRYTP